MFPQLGLIWRSAINVNIRKKPSFLVNVNRISHCSSTHNKAAHLIHRNMFGLIPPTITALQNRGKAQREVKRDCYRHMLACLLRPTVHLSKQHRRILFKFTRWPRSELCPSQTSWYQSQKQIKGDGTTWRWEQRGRTFIPDVFNISQPQRKTAVKGDSCADLFGCYRSCMRTWELSCGHILFLLAVLNWIYFPSDFFLWSFLTQTTMLLMLSKVPKVDRLKIYFKRTENRLLTSKPMMRIW